MGAGRPRFRRFRENLVLGAIAVVVCVLSVFVFGGLPGESRPLSRAEILSRLRESSNTYLMDSDKEGFALFRSGRPAIEQDIRDWCALGISEVMLLSGDPEKAEERWEGACPGLRVSYSVMQDVGRPVTEAFLRDFDEWIARARKEHRAVLFRCVCGCHRTGRLAAYYEMKYMQHSYDEVVQSMYERGKYMDQFPELPLQVAALQDYIADKPCRYAEQSTSHVCVARDAQGSAS